MVLKGFLTFLYCKIRSTTNLYALLQGVVSSGVVGRDGRVGHFVGSGATIKQYGLAIARRSVEVCAVKQ